MLALELPIAPGTYLIEASAGTGKTWTIAALYLRLLVSGSHQPPLELNDILVVTFSKAATAELKERLRARIQEALAFLKHPATAPKDAYLAELLADPAEHPRQMQRLQHALWAFDQASIHTIHGFCLRALTDHAFAAQASPVATLSHGAELLDEAHIDFWRHCIQKNSYIAQLVVDHGLTPAKLWQDICGLIDKPYRLGAPLNLDPIDEAPWLAWCAHPDRPQAMHQLLAARGAFNASKLRPAFWTMVEAMAHPTPQRPHEPDGLEKLIPSNLASCLKKGMNHPWPEVLALVAPCVAMLRLRQAQRDDLCLYAKGWIEKRALQLRRQQARRNYDDLLHDLAHMLDTQPALKVALQNSHRAVLIDEFQDTDPLQWQIFSGLFGQGQHVFYLVGDPKQAIYSFRGADVFTYLKARTRSQQCFTLQTNFRSRPALLSGLNALYRRTEQPFVFPEIPYQPFDSGPLGALKRGQLPDHHRAINFIYVAPPEDKTRLDGWRNHMACATARTIAKLLEPAHGFQPQDVAILVGNHAQGDRIKTHLHHWGIGANHLGKKLIFNTQEAVALDVVLYAWLQPEESRIRAVHASAVYGHRWPEEPNADEFHQYVHEAALWRNHGIVHALGYSAVRWCVVGSI